MSFLTLYVLRWFSMLDKATHQQEGTLSPNPIFSLSKVSISLLGPEIALDGQRRSEMNFYGIEADRRVPVLSRGRESMAPGSDTTFN